MAKYLMLKHYHSPKAHYGPPGEQWTPEEWDAHVKYMDEFADRLRETGEFVSSTALAMDGDRIVDSAPIRRTVTDCSMHDPHSIHAGKGLSSGVL